MNVFPMRVPDVLLLAPVVHGDARGVFLEGWNAREYAVAGIPEHWVQDNMSESVRGVLRGLHCQVRQVQGKLVRCVAGAVFDVAVDLRAPSPTFGQWCGAQLDAETHTAMWIPAGFAHGYYVLSQRATVHYKATDYYAPGHERCLRWDDPDVGIEWPLIDGATPILAEKDAGGCALAQARDWFV
ncbi:MAG TPA: dTDP-4-dehydrorhamnose 3,5-epimerase [Gemmatimonadaceae bacterium]